VSGILAAIAIPNFIRFTAQSKQSECKIHLRSLYSHERSLYLENEAYSNDLSDLKSAFDGRLNYAYFLDSNLEVGSTAVAPTVDRTTPMDVKKAFESLPAGLASELGITGQCPDCAFTFVCVGQLDGDDTLDVWSLSSKDRQAEDGGFIPAGTPHNHVNDVVD